MDFQEVGEMLIRMKSDSSEGEKKYVVDAIQKKGLQAKVMGGVIGILGDTSKLEVKELESLGGVEGVRRIPEPGTAEAAPGMEKRSVGGGVLRVKMF